VPGQGVDRERRTGREIPRTETDFPHREAEPDDPDLARLPRSLPTRAGTSRREGKVRASMADNGMTNPHEHRLRRFRAECRNGNRPEIRDYLAGVASEDRAELLRALIREELDQLRRRGRFPGREEYLEPFTDPDREVAGAAFDESGVAGLAATEPDKEHGESVFVPPTAEGPTDSGPEQRGARIGKYEIDEFLGGGGMGETYKARNLRMPSKWVVVKVIRSELAMNPDFVNRFHQEIDRLAALPNHANIVTALDAGSTDSPRRHYFVMEYVDGEDLHKEIKRRGPLPVPEACRYARQVAEGLQHLADHGTVHRDIKPSNLLRAAKGPVVKIADFGLAFSPEGGATMTKVGEIFGSPDYISPEQARNPHAVDIRADIYSLGCTLYHLLAGQPPFPGGGALQKLHSHEAKVPTPLDQLRPGLPRGLPEVVRRMMAKKPGDRFQTPIEVVEALGPYCGSDRAPVEGTIDRRWMIGAGVVATVLMIVGGLGAFLGMKIAGSRSPHMAFTERAWADYKAGDYQAALDPAGRCVREFKGAADRLQEQLAGDRVQIPEGKVGPEEQARIFENGVLNDVATCLWIMGRSRENLRQFDQARQAYEQAKLLTHARCWSPEDRTFWSPALKAIDDLENLDKAQGH
jgi:hypothetical protein